MKKYSVIHMVAIGSGQYQSYIPKLLRIKTGNLDAFLDNNPYYDDVQFIFDGFVVETIRKG